MTPGDCDSDGGTDTQAQRGRETRFDAGPGGVTDFDAVVVGAGFSGLYMIHRLRELGLSVRGYEKADGVGGTWYWNRYPGARCDSESHIYCYSFSEELLEEWTWSERYPEQPEILEYLQFAADRLDLRRDIEFGTEITRASYSADTGTWTVETDDGSSVSTRFFISAVGCLSEPFVPEFDNRERFEGEQYHTARWPEGGVDVGDSAVGVVGTGSSGIQVIPELAERAEHLTVFQRTPNYAVPARNRPLEPGEFEQIRREYDEIREDARNSWLGMPFDNEYDSAASLSEAEIEAALERRWQQGGFRFLHTFDVGSVITDEALNETISEFIRSKIRERVDDSDTAETLVPTDHPYAAKRPPMDYGGYYETFNRDDVRLVDVEAAPVQQLTANGIRTTEAHYELDTIVFATGFDAMTGALLEMDIQGREASLDQKWADGPRTYLGLGVHGFPNLFTITGPQSPSVLTNMPVSIEQHVEWIADCISHMLTAGYTRIEATETAETQWVSQTNVVADGMLFSEAESWYRGANVPGKPRIFTPYPGGFDTYRRICANAAEDDYDGFELRGPADAPTAGD
jgi:cation diffusion facilitator CzcD-associated flavoprotein CzcO